MNPFKNIQELVIGRKLGSGFSRDVYEWLPDSKSVIKVAKGYRGIEANVIEFNTWETLENKGSFYDNARKWFAPCLEISNCGTFLRMRKTEPLRAHEAPTVIPSFVTDLKLSNIGWLEGRVVFHDYGLHLWVEEAIDLKKAIIVKKDVWLE